MYVRCTMVSALSFCPPPAPAHTHTCHRHPRSASHLVVVPLLYTLFTRDRHRYLSEWPPSNRSIRNRTVTASSDVVVQDGRGRVGDSSSSWNHNQKQAMRNTLSTDRLALAAICSRNTPPPPLALVLWYDVYISPRSPRSLSSIPIPVPFALPMRRILLLLALSLVLVAAPVQATTQAKQRHKHSGAGFSDLMLG
ncbi:hypothetical protein LX36DRAFT_298865 [Colletotrichum falcatum]|nr:hypothetical protein LX36DRAFT_298865 [Colletotrichum falcatum]